MLKVEGLDCIYHHAIQALSAVSITVSEGEIVGLLGANGAGKTTVLRCVTGEIRFLNGEVARGEIQYNGESLIRFQPFEVAKRGISIVPEDRKLFVDMKVEENLMMGAYTILDGKVIRKNYRKVFNYFPILEELRHRLVGYLSGGEQQMLAIARALMSSPKLILLDEPSTGLAPRIMTEIFSIIEKIKKEDRTSILLVEQNVHMTLRIADTCFILENGRTVFQGKPDALNNNQLIKNIYLGISDEKAFHSIEKGG